MSSNGTLASGAYTDSVAQAAQQHQDFVMGFISVNPAGWSSGPAPPGVCVCICERMRAWVGECRICTKQHES
jgi:hypothetical protein